MLKKISILILETGCELEKALHQAFELHADLAITTIDKAESVPGLLGSVGVELFLIDSGQVNTDLLDYIKRVQQVKPDVGIIITGDTLPAPDQLVLLLKHGAFDYIARPFSGDRLKNAVLGGIENRAAFRHVMQMSEEIMEANNRLQQEKEKLSKKIRQDSVLQHISRIANQEIQLDKGLFESVEGIYDGLPVDGVILLCLEGGGDVDGEGDSNRETGLLTCKCAGSPGSCQSSITVPVDIAAAIRCESGKTGDVTGDVNEAPALTGGAEEKINSDLLDRLLKAAGLADFNIKAPPVVSLALKTGALVTGVTGVTGRLFLLCGRRPDFVNEKGFLSMLTGQVTTLISRIKMFNDIKRERDRLKKWNSDLNQFNRISHSIVGSLDRNLIISEFASNLTQLVAYDMISILLFASNTLWTFAAGDYADYREALDLDTLKKFGNRKNKGMRLTGPAACITNLEMLPKEGKEVHIPLEVAGMRVGIIRLIRFESSGFDEYQTRLLSMISSPLALGLKNAEVHRQVRDMALRDSLTNLLNKRSFLLSLSEQFEKSRKTGSPLSFLMIDVDFFKTINDTYGHQAGDEVLKEVARLISLGIRDLDIAARYGGEEFAIILPDVTLKVAGDIADRLREKLSSYRFHYGSSDMTLTISIGVSQASYLESSTPDQLVELADKALYRAKKLGRNRVETGLDVPAEV